MKQTTQEYYNQLAREQHYPKNLNNNLPRTIGIVLALLLMSTAAWAVSSVTNGFQAGWYSEDLNMDNNSISNVGTPFCSGASYCIYNQSGTIIAVNGTTQNLDYNGTNANQILNNVFYTGLDQNRTYKQKVILINSFNLNVTLPGFLILDITKAYIKASEPYNGYVFETYNSSIDIIGGIIDGNSSGIPTGTAGVLNGSAVYIHGKTAQDAPSDVNMYGTTITGAHNRGLLIRNLKNSVFRDLNITNNGMGGIDNAIASGANSRSYHSGVTFNKIILDNNMDYGASPGISEGISYNDIIVTNTIYNPNFPSNIPSGISLDRGHNITISGCIVKNNLGWGVSLFKVSGATLRINTISNCFSQNNTLGGYNIANSNDTTLSNSNSIDEGINLKLNANSDNIKIINNNFIDAKNESIYLTASTNIGTNIILNGNTIKNWNMSGNLGYYGGINITSEIRSAYIDGNIFIKDDNIGTAISIASNPGSIYIGDNIYPNILRVNGTWSPYKTYNNLISNGNYESWSNSSVPDGWTKNHANSTVSVKETTSVKIGGTSVNVSSTSTYQFIKQDVFDAHFKGKVVTYGSWVKSNFSNSARIAILDDVAAVSYSANHSGSGNWEFLTVTMKLSTNALDLKVRNQVNSPSEYAYFDGSILVEGKDISDFSEKSLIDDGYNIQINSTSNNVTIPNLITTNLTVNGVAYTNNVLTNVSIPATSSSSCSTNDIAYNSSYFYVCISPNTWVRANMSTW